MKKLLLSITLIAFFSCLCNYEVKAQSPRMQLFEYFDNTSIPPFGAVADSIFDTLANANSADVIFIKYHVSWGSADNTDPMNLQNPLQPLARVHYYKITSDPLAIQDGGVKTDNTFNTQPSTLTQSFITSRAAITSPFTMSVSHSFSPAYDSINSHVVIKKTGAARDTLTAQVVVIERNIHFSYPPGVIKDLNFRNVMKEMLPSDLGTLLPNGMKVGDSLVLNLSWKLANIYDATQLAVVSFVQGKDSANREVYQAGYSAPIPLADNAIVSLYSSPSFSCDSITPVITLKNNGYDTLRKCTLNYRIDNGMLVAIPWAGTLLAGASANVTLPKLFDTGYHSLIIYASNPNDSPEIAQLNDTAFTHFSGVSGPKVIPLAEGFEDASFPPPGWGLGNPDNFGTWLQGKAGGYGKSKHSAEIDWWNILPRAFNDMYPPELNLSSNTERPGLQFDVAYATFPRAIDTLEVRASTDCGLTWSTVYLKSGAGLATAPVDSTAEFVPNSNQWRTDTVNLFNYIGKPDVLLQFHAISGFGNDLYLDNVNIITNVGIKSVTDATRFNVYPNPSQGNFTVVSSHFINNGMLEVYNVLGEKVYEANMNFASVKEVNLGNIPSGVYFIRLNTVNSTAANKVIIQK